MQRVRLVNAFQVAGFEIVEHLGHDQLRLADDYRVGMGQRFLAHEARVYAAHDDGNSAAPELIGNLVTALHVTGHGRNSDHIDFQVEIDLLDILVGQYDLILILRYAGRNREQTRQRRIKRAIQVARSRGERVCLGVDQMDDPGAH